MSILVAFVVATLLSAGCLWLGMKLTGVGGTFFAMLLIAAICAVLLQLPLIGWLVALIVMFVLIKKWTDASIWPDAVLMVVVAYLVAFLASFMLGA